MHVDISQRGLSREYWPFGKHISTCAYRKSDRAGNFFDVSDPNCTTRDFISRESSTGNAKIYTDHVFHWNSNEKNTRRLK